MTAHSPPQIEFSCLNPGALVNVALSHSTQGLAFRPPSSSYSTARSLESQVSFFGLRDTLKTLVDGFGLDLLAAMTSATDGTGGRVETLLAEGWISCVSTSGAEQRTLLCDSGNAPQLVPSPMSRYSRLCGLSSSSSLQ